MELYILKAFPPKVMFSFSFQVMFSFSFPSLAPFVLFSKWVDFGVFHMLEA